MKDNQLRFTVEPRGPYLRAAVEHKGITITADFTSLDGALKWIRYHLRDLVEEADWDSEAARRALLSLPLEPPIDLLDKLEDIFPSCSGKNS